MKSHWLTTHPWPWPVYGVWVIETDICQGLIMRTLLARVYHLHIESFVVGFCYYSIYKPMNSHRLFSWSFIFIHVSGYTVACVQDMLHIGYGPRLKSTGITLCGWCDTQILNWCKLYEIGIN
jgi:hypothetical protein